MERINQQVRHAHSITGCSTFLCLKYRGANPYCSLKCTVDSECGEVLSISGDCQILQVTQI